MHLSRFLRVYVRFESIWLKNIICLIFFVPVIFSLVVFILLLVLLELVFTFRKVRLFSHNLFVDWFVI